MQLTHIRHRLLLTLLTLGLGLLMATGWTVSEPASARGYPTTAWPTAWANPLGSGGSFVMTTKWGAFSRGCRNADLSNDAGYYLNSGTSAHTGVDMNRGDGQEVYAIADGTVVENGQPWGPANRNVVVVEHTASSGEHFLAVYGHLYGDTVGKGPIARGARIGRVQNAGTGPHLHLGIRPGSWTGATPNGSSASSMDGNGNCGFNTVGTVDPLSYLAARAPGSGATWPPADGSYVHVRETGMIFRIAGGAPLYVGSWDHLGGPQPAPDISQAQLDSLPVYPANGTLIAGQPSGRVFRVAGGAPLYVSSWAAIGGEQPALSVDDAAIDNAGGGVPWNHLRATPNDLFLHGRVSGRVFRVVTGHPYYVPSWDPYGGGQPVVDVDDWALDHCDHLSCNPFGSLDVASDAGNRVRVSGWGMDPSSTDPIGIHVYVDDTFAGSGTADVPRGDVDAVFHRGERFGFDLTVPAIPGQHKVCAYGLNVGLGDNDLLGCSTATVTAAPASTSAPTLEGSVRVGATVTCLPGSWENTDRLTYAWTAGGVDIDGVGETTYTVPETLVGSRLACRVTGTNAVGSTTAISEAVTIAVGPALTTTKAPAATGTAAVGKRLKVSPGAWSPAAQSFTYQWRRNGKTIKGATASSYKLVKKDRKQKITCTVIAAREGWASGSAVTPAKKVR